VFEREKLWESAAGPVQPGSSLHLCAASLDLEPQLSSGPSGGLRCRCGKVDFTVAVLYDTAGGTMPTGLTLRTPLRCGSLANNGMGKVRLWVRKAND